MCITEDLLFLLGFFFRRRGEDVPFCVHVNGYQNEHLIE